VLVGLVDSDAEILKEADGLGLKVPAFDPGGITGNDTFLHAAGALADGLVGNTPTDPQRKTAAAKALVASFKKGTTETVVPDPAAFTYEGIQAIAKAFELGASGRDDLASYLHRVDLADTGVGALKFDAGGARLGGRLWVFTVRDGKLTFTGGYEQTGPTETREIPLER
jgi:ABC-type branched-subunit amino acid transport system substrate-binding protein